MYVLWRVRRKTDPHTGPQAKTAEGTVQRTVAGDLRGGGTILQTNVPAEFPACPVASPIALITAGLMALCFMGFSGLQIPW